MSNTTLPTGLNSGNINHISNHNTLHSEMNELSRRTGRRMATSLLTNGWVHRPQSDASRGVHIERIRDLVYVHISGLDGTNATSPLFLKFAETTDVSTNFMPYGGYWHSAIESDNAGGTWLLQAGADGLQIISEGQDYKRYLGGWWRTFIYHTRQGWPSFLPPEAPM